MNTRQFFLVAFWAALAFAVTMALLPQPPGIIVEIGDKYQHMLAFATLALLAALAWPDTRLLTIGVRLALVGAAIEIGQMIPMLHRDGDLGDWIADVAAITLALAIVAVLRHRMTAIGGPR